MKFRFFRYVDIPNPKPGGRSMRSLVSYMIPMPEFLCTYEQQCNLGKKLAWDSAIQLYAIKLLRKPSSLPNNCASVDFDFATLINFLSGMNQSQGEFLGSGKFSIETYILHMKLPSDRKLKLAERIRKLILQGFSADKGKDVFTHMEHFEKVLGILTKEAPSTKIVYKNSDGPGTYKGAPRFIADKALSVKSKIGFMASFCPPGMGKGEHDREGGLTASNYSKQCAHALGTDARNLDKVVLWNEKNRASMKSKNSSTEARIFFHSSFEDVDARRKLAPAIESLFCHEKGFITRKNYCYYVSPDPAERGVWYRRYTCASCELCQTGDWDSIIQCKNKICGPWRFILFESRECGTLGKKRKATEGYVNPIQKFKCNCGGQFSRGSHYGHFKTKRHLRYVKEEAQKEKE